MNFEFRKLKISEFAKVQGGYAFKSKDLGESGFPVIKITNVKERLIDLGSLQYLPEEKLQGLERFYIKNGDVLISMTGNGAHCNSALVGRTALFEEEDDKYLLNQRVGRFIVDETKVLKNYLYYYISQPSINYYLATISTGSANQANINASTIEGLELNIPSINCQKQVVAILSSLDRKITINKRINKNLENVAQSLFQSWFVDFDPVQAKKLALDKGLSPALAERAAIAIISGVCSPINFAENFEEMDKQLSVKLSKMSIEKQEELAHTASLFPSEFEDSENGTIPKGFKAKLISDIADVIGGGTPSTKVEEYFCLSETGIPWLSPKDLSGYDWKYISNGATDITELGLKKSSAKLMPKGTVVISSRAPIGYVAIAEGELSTNQGFKSLVPLEDIGSNFLYNWAKSNIVAMEAVATGSTFKEISGTNMKNLKIIVPINDLIRRFEELVEHNSELQKNLRHETKNLEVLRDTLLPKLLAGEIDLSEVSLD